MKLKIERAMLVYQAGIANVFAVDCFNTRASGRTERRLLQHAFGPCEAFARGLAAAGVLVATAHCNEAGDIARRDWSNELEEAPFADKFCPVFAGVSVARFTAREIAAERNAFYGQPARAAATPESDGGK